MIKRRRINQIRAKAADTIYAVVVCRKLSPANTYRLLHELQEDGFDPDDVTFEIADAIAAVVRASLFSRTWQTLVPFNTAWQIVWASLEERINDD